MVAVYLFLVLLFSAIPLIFAVDPTVDLTYAKYRGYADPANGVTEWLGMRYARSPTGVRRFAAPEDPELESTTQDATEYGKDCLGLGARPGRATSEDCLFLDVFTPTQSTSKSKFPVYVFIQGGGFAQNANINFNGRGLIEASNHSVVVVTFNYRVGVYGFISGKEVESANNGLKDQRKALEWVQRHISKFGGDPEHVVLGGDSAGAASITLHLTAFGGRNDKLFVGAAAESQSFAPILTVKESQFQYNGFVNSTRCAKDKDTLNCLRSLSVDELQKAGRAMPYPGSPGGPPLYSWNPVIDGDMIRDLTYRAYDKGDFIKMPVIFGADTNDGTVFAPRAARTIQDTNKFLRQNFPGLTTTHLKKLQNLYPQVTIDFPEEPGKSAGRYWRQASDVYGDIRYMCPGLYLSSALTRHGVANTWNYRYNVEDPVQMKQGLGVPHTIETIAIFGPENVGATFVPLSYKAGQSNSEIVDIMQSYWVSFIKTLDPNTHRRLGAPMWEKWTEAKMNRLMFDSPPKDTRMEQVEQRQKTRCEYIWSIALDIQQ